MPLLTVLTAAHAGRADMLAEAGHSLSNQDLPGTWRFEWVIQEDGPAPELEGVVSKFPFARYQANGASLGIGTTRNLALTRADGQLVTVLDSDDLLLPGALRVAIEVFRDNPSVHWVSAQAYDLLADGTRLAFDPLLPPGDIEPGVVNAFLAQHGKLPFFTAGMTLRTSTVRAVGGWAANPRIEEGPMIAAITELTPGYLTPETTWLVRQHPGRTTQHPDWKARLVVESMAMINQRVAAMRELGVRVSGSAA